MKHRPPELQIESRWPVAFTIFVVLFLLAVLPARVRFFPAWFSFCAGLLMFAAILAVPLSGAKAKWRWLERKVMGLFCGVMGLMTLVCLGYLMREMVRGSTELDGFEMLTSSIAVWMANILIFALVYWLFDRGGPEARINQPDIPPDWLFPQMTLPPESLPPWSPHFLDYLFLSFIAATAFSPAETLPLTVRAKMLLMLEIIIGLVAIVVVASRAIGVLNV